MPGIYSRWRELTCPICEKHIQQPILSKKDSEGSLAKHIQEEHRNENLYPNYKKILSKLKLEEEENLKSKLTPQLLEKLCRYEAATMGLKRKKTT